MWDYTPAGRHILPNKNASFGDGLLSHWLTVSLRSQALWVTVSAAGHPPQPDGKSLLSLKTPLPLSQDMERLSRHSLEAPPLLANVYRAGRRCAHPQREETIVLTQLWTLQATVTTWMQGNVFLMMTFFESSQSWFVSAFEVLKSDVWGEGSHLSVVEHKSCVPL